MGAGEIGCVQRCPLLLGFDDFSNDFSGAFSAPPARKVPQTRLRSEFRRSGA